MFRYFAFAAALTALVPSCAYANVPLKYKWRVEYPTGICAETPCRSFDSAEDACNAYGLDAGYWNIHLSPESGVPPTRGKHSCLANSPGCPSADNCTTGVLAVQPLPSIGTACPINSDSTGADCACKLGSQEAEGTCSGGKNNGACCATVPLGNPTNPANGNKVQRQIIYQGPNGFELTLTFNTFDQFKLLFGRHWRGSFDRRIWSDGTTALAYRPDGTVLHFTPNGSGGWNADADTPERLVRTSEGWQFTSSNDDLEIYDNDSTTQAGKLLTTKSRSGLLQTLIYSDGSQGPNGGVVLDANGKPIIANGFPVSLAAGHLVGVTDAFGRRLKFEYDGAFRVVKVTDPGNGIYLFRYVFQDKLSSITFPATAAFPSGTTITYLYNEPAYVDADLPDALTGIIQENNARFATFNYLADYRAKSTERADATLKYQFSYSTNSTSVTDPLGTSRTYNFQTILGSLKTNSIAGASCPDCGPFGQTFFASGDVQTSTDWNLTQTSYTYTLTGNLEATRTEGSNSSGIAPAPRKITTTWDTNFRLPATIAEPLRLTTNTYDPDGK